LKVSLYRIILDVDVDHNYINISGLIVHTLRMMNIMLAIMFEQSINNIKKLK